MKQKGVSLFEITIVVFIMVTVFAIAFPRIPMLFDSKLEREVKKFTSLLHELRMNAILDNKKIRILLDPEKKRYTIEQEEKDDKTHKIKYTPLNESSVHDLPVPVEISDIRLKDDHDHDLFDITKVAISIEPIGFIDLFSIVFHDKDNSIQVSVVNLSGKTEISLPQPYRP